MTESDAHVPIALIRHGFGGYQLDVDADIAEERRTGRSNKI